jgi:S-adenosylmethionine synthetase
LSLPCSLSKRVLDVDRAELKPPRALPPIIHYSAAEPFTKYEMCLVFAKILGLPHGHIVPDAKGEAAVTRPRESQLHVGETEALGVEGGLGCEGFEEWWEEYLKAGQSSG